MAQLRARNHVLVSSSHLQTDHFVCSTNDRGNVVEINEKILMGIWLRRLQGNLYYDALVISGI